MPTYDFTCRSCAARFEDWVRKPDDRPACPECDGRDVERELSVPTVHSSTTRARSMRAARRRDHRQQHEHMKARLEYEAGHDD